MATSVALQLFSLNSACWLGNEHNVVALLYLYIFESVTMKFVTDIYSIHGINIRRFHVPSFDISKATLLNWWKDMTWSSSSVSSRNDRCNIKSLDVDLLWILFNKIKKIRNTCGNISFSKIPKFNLGSITKHTPLENLNIYSGRHSVCDNAWQLAKFQRCTIYLIFW